MRRRHMLLLAGVGAGPARPTIAGAQAGWPARPVRIIVPFPPGGSTDLIARILQPPLSAALGMPVVIENRGGASGSIGGGEAARSEPDGHSWLLAYDNEATNQTLLRLPYRTLEALAPVTLIATGPLCLATHESEPYRSFGDVVEAAQRAPDSIAYATSGAGGLAHVSTVLLQQRGRFRLVHLPYRGGGPALQQAVAGQVPLFMSNVLVLNASMRAGRLRPLGVTTRAESRHVPGVPSFAQQGFEGFEAPTWWALLGRAGTPEPILRRMQEAMAQVLALPEVRLRIEEQGADVVGGSAEACRAFVAAQIETWGRVIRDHGIDANS